MGSEVAASTERLPTVSAPMWSLLFVDGDLVDGDTAATCEALPADRTGEGPGPSMDPQVSRQVGASGETAAADAAAKSLSVECT